MVRIADFLPFFGLAALVQGQCAGPAVNQATLDLIKEFEGWRASPYNDPTGHKTIGYGHLCADSSCSDVPYPKPLSYANGQKLLQSDLRTFQNCITTMTNSGVRLDRNSYGAIVSWAFNVGCGNARSSTLIRRLNAGESGKPVIRQELPKWTKSNGQTLPGLVRRRNAEVALSDKSTSVGALPACS